MLTAKRIQTTSSKTQYCSREEHQNHETKMLLLPTKIGHALFGYRLSNTLHYQQNYHKLCKVAYCCIPLLRPSRFYIFKVFFGELLELLIIISKPSTVLQAYIIYVVKFRFFLLFLPLGCLLQSRLEKPSAAVRFADGVSVPCCLNLM